MNELDQISDYTHDKEANADSLANFQKFPSIRLCASRKELCAVLDEVARNIHEFLKLVRHDCDVVCNWKCVGRKAVYAIMYRGGRRLGEFVEGDN